MLRANRFLAIIALFFFVVIMGSCGGGGGGSSSSGSNNVSSTIIGPNGGTATSADGKVKIQVPAGSLASDITINIAITGDNMGQVGSRYQVSGQGGADLVFSQPVTIKVNYDPNLLPTGTNEGILQLALLVPFDSWEILTDSTVDTINHTITATGSHFSSVGILLSVPTVSALKLSFPLPKRNPCNAAINSVFDHSMSKQYTADGIVKDYKGEVGSGDFCGCFTLKGQVLCCYGSGTSFTVNGNYTGGECGNVFLSYDGHPGYDYKTTDQAPANGHIDVLAAADGIAHVPSSSEYGTIWIDHGNGYSTWYLHLSQRLVTDGNAVKRGDKIGVSGNISPFYVGPHLHFEVRKNNVPVDPYAENLWETGTTDVIPPTTPTGVAANVISSSQINLSWNASTDNVGVAGYKIYDYYGTYLNSVTSTSTSITGLNSNTYYCFLVSAYDAVGNESGQSTQACATTLSTPDTTPPSIPTGLTTTAVSSSQINLSWNASTNNVGVAGYKVYRSSSFLKSATTTSTSDSGLSPSTQYCYNVSAYDAAGNESGQSSQACAVTLAAPTTNSIYVSSGQGTGSGPSYLFSVVPTANGSDISIGLIFTSNGFQPVVTDLALTPSGTLYGVSFDTLYIIDKATATATPVGFLGFSDVNALASNGQGNLFGATVSGYLLRINTNTGAATPVGQFGSGFTSSGDLAFSPNGILYAAVYALNIQNNLIVTVDPNSGIATRVNNTIDTGVTKIFGLSFVNGQLYGVTAGSPNGALWLIDVNTGQASFVRNLSFSAFGAASVKNRR